MTSVEPLPRRGSLSSSLPVCSRFFQVRHNRLVNV